MKKTAALMLAVILLCTACVGKEPDGQKGAMNQSGSPTEGTLDGDSDTQNDLPGSTPDADSGTEIQSNPAGMNGSDDDSFISDKEDPEADMPDERILDADIRMDEDVKEMFKAVLLGDASLLYVPDREPENVDLAPYWDPYISDGAEAVNITDIPLIIDAYDPIMEIQNFAVTDLDGDGEDEVILFVCGIAGDSSGRVILHRIGDKVYGYRSGSRTVWRLKTDGTYLYSSSVVSQEDGIVSVAEFTETGYTVEKLYHATGNPMDGYTEFFVNEQPATEEAYRELDKIQDKKPDAEWYEFTEANINAMF